MYRAADFSSGLSFDVELVQVMGGNNFSINRMETTRQQCPPRDYYRCPPPEIVVPPHHHSVIESPVSSQNSTSSTSSLVEPEGSREEVQVTSDSTPTLTRDEIFEMLRQLTLHYAPLLRGRDGLHGGPEGRRGPPGPPGIGRMGPRGHRGLPGQVEHDFSWYRLGIEQVANVIHFSTEPFSNDSGYLSLIYTTTPRLYVTSVILSLAENTMTWRVQTAGKFELMYLSYKGLTLSSDNGIFNLDLGSHFNRYIKPEAEYTLAVRWTSS